MDKIPRTFGIRLVQGIKSTDYVVTGCQDNLITELGGRPAYEVLKEVYTRASPDDQALMQDGKALQERMAARNVLLSRLGMDGNPRLENYIRFSMGTPEEVQVAVAALRAELGA